MKKSRYGCLAVLLLVVLSGCSSVQPIPYAGVASSSYLKPNTRDKTGRVPYSYTAENVDWSGYKKVMVNPVAIYVGRDNQFDDVKQENQEELAQYMRDTFTDKLEDRFEVVKRPGPGTLRVNLTLTGAKTSTPVLSTLSRFDLAGGVYNGIQTARGKEGAMTGYVVYAVEIYDAMTNKLLTAYVSKQYPSPWNLGASIGALSASKAGVDKGAEALMTRLK